LAKKTKQDWFNIAYECLIESGVEAIAAEKLASKLGVSRGSFYHHFGSKQGFHRALLEDWFEKNTLRINQLNHGKPIEDKITSLTNFAWALPHKIEVAIRAWALYDELAKEYQIKTDQIRINYLTELFAEKYSSEKAGEAAKVLFYSFVGLQNRQPMPSKYEFNQFQTVISRVVQSYLDF